MQFRSDERPGAAELADRAAALVLAAESPNTIRTGHESPRDEAAVVRWKRGMYRMNGKAPDRKHPFIDDITWPPSPACLQPLLVPATAQFLRSASYRRFGARISRR